jgi:hypothetical protein
MRWFQYGLGLARVPPGSSFGIAGAAAPLNMCTPPKAKKSGTAIAAHKSATLQTERESWVLP